jgi:hypothetical protein
MGNGRGLAETDVFDGNNTDWYSILFLTTHTRYNLNCYELERLLLCQTQVIIDILDCLLRPERENPLESVDLFRCSLS